MSKKRYDVISPDGIPIRYFNWKTKKEAQQGLLTWMERYETQGYYSSNQGRIPLDKLESQCKIIEI